MPPDDADFEQFRGLLLRFRGRTGLSQAHLADQAGVHLRSVQAWESGVSLPSAERLPALIAALLSFGGFAASHEAEDARALWTAAERESSRHRPPLDEEWFARLIPPRSPVSAGSVSAGSVSASSGAAQDWGDAPDTTVLHGRRAELGLLERAVVDERARVLVLHGMGGIGKTSLAARLSHTLAASFDSTYWRSVRDAPSFNAWSTGAIGFLSDHQRIPPDDELESAELLVDLLRARRSLLVLDNLESLLQAGKTDGSFRAEDRAYAEFLRAASEREHASCVLVTSREVPLSLVETRARIVEVRGLPVDDARLLLDDKHLVATADDWQALVTRYGGNGLALRLVGDTIQTVFAGDIAAFLEQMPSGMVFGGVRQLVEGQLERLSLVEADILDLLALAREPVSFLSIASVLVPRISRAAVVEGVEALRHRSLIESSGPGRGFTLQSVVLECATDRLVKRVASEIAQGPLELLLRWPLLSAQATDHVRRTQELLILRPVLDELIARAGDSRAVERQFEALLDDLRTRPARAQGQAPGTIANLLSLQRGHLRGVDLSQLAISDAMLQDVEAQDANLAYATLSDCLLDDTFGTVAAVAITPDAALVAAGTLEGTLRVWRRADRAPLLAVRGHVGAVWGVALSADGRLLASAGVDGSLHLWDVETAATHAVAHELGGGMAQVAMSGDARVLAAGGFDGAIRVWSLPDEQLLATLSGHHGAAYSVALGEGGATLISGGVDGVVRVWNPREARVRADTGARLNLNGHTGPVWCVALSADGLTAASGGRDATLRIWDVAGDGHGAELARFEDHVGAVRGAALSADGRIVASGGFDGIVRVWDVATARRLASLPAHAGGVRGVALTADGGTLVSGGFDAAVRVWDTRSGVQTMSLQGHLGGVRGVALSVDGSSVVSGGPDATIRVWDTRGLRSRWELAGHTAGARAVAISDSGMVASTGLDGSVRLWSGETGRAAGVLRGHTSGALAVALSADGLRAASGGLDGAVRVWDTARRLCTRMLDGRSGAIWGVALNPAGVTVVSCGLDTLIRIWDADDGRLVRTLAGHTSGVRGVALSGDGQRLASCGDDGVVRIWDADSGAGLAVLEGHAAAVYGVSVTRDGRTVASAGFDATVRVWDAAAAQPLAVLRDHADAVYTVAFSADGARLASGSLDGTVKIWSTGTWSLLGTLRPDRRYERMDITGLQGVTPAQRSTLLALGAVERA
jgi:WD40 repeat protein/transcriptional regulator with XRE-family HTH domain